MEDKNDVSKIYFNQIPGGVLSLEILMKGARFTYMFKHPLKIEEKN